MDPTVIGILHDILVKKPHKTGYESVTIDYSPELYGDITDGFYDYFLLWYTVCGAQDPAVIYLNEGLGKKYPELAKYSVVRVIDKFLNSWSSQTLLEFSNQDVTDKEYEMYEKLMKEEESNYGVSK